MKTYLPLLIVMIGCFGCKPSKEVTKTPSTPVSKKSQKSPDFFKTPEQQLAKPSILLINTFGQKGTSTYKNEQGQVNLEQIGVHRCIKGWAIQGYARKGANLAIKDTFFLPDLPKNSGKFTIPPDLHPHKKTINADIKKLSLNKIEGTFKVTQGKNVSTWHINAQPVPVASAQGMGHVGCFHTGHASLTLGTQKHTTPMTGVWSNGGMYQMYIPFNKTQRLVIWLKLPAYKRRPNERIKADLAKIFTAPNKHNVRVLFETRGKAAQDKALIPAESGKLTLMFKKNDKGGPIEIKLKDIAMPKSWLDANKGLAKMLDGEGVVGFTTDLKGLRVPVIPVPN